MDQKEIKFEISLPEAEKPPEKETVQTEKTEVIISPETLEFMRNHLDLAEFLPNWELYNIRKFVRRFPRDVQSGQRKKLIREFKMKLGTMRENMANAQIEIEQFFRDNPDVPEKEAKTKLDEIIKRNTISYYHSDFIKAVDQYLEIRDNVRNITRRYKESFENTKQGWEAELFKDLFGRYPNGKIEIENTLAGLYIRIFDIEDYVAAFIGDRKTELVQRAARMSGGAQLNRRHEKLPELSGKITIENGAVWDKEGSEKTKTHEEEHSIHKNLHPQWLFGHQEYFWPFEKNSKISYENFVRALSDLNKKLVNFYEGGVAKTEILAYLKEGRLNLEGIKSLLKENGGLYDMLEYGEKYIETIQIRKNAFQIMGFKIEVDGRILDEDEVVKIAVEIFRTAYFRHYRKDLESAFDAVLKLLNKYGSDPQNRAKVINLLSQEPLNKWPRLARILS